MRPGGCLLVFFFMSCSPQVTFNPCSFSLAYLGPSQASSFEGLGEDSGQCLMSSWREFYVSEPPSEFSFFMAEQCGNGNADGTLEHPYCDWDHLLSAVSDFLTREKEATPVIHLEPGRYTTNITIKDTLSRFEWRGLCSEITQISPEDEDAPLIQTASTGSNFSIALKNVTLSGGGQPHLSLGTGTAILEQVSIVNGNNNECLLVEGSSSTLTATGLTLTAQAADSVVNPESSGNPVSELSVPGSSSSVPICVRVRDGGILIMDNFHLHEFQGIGIQVIDSGSQAKLSNGIVEGTRTTDAGDFGYGMTVEDGGEAVLEEVTLQDNNGVNLIGSGAETHVVVNQSFLGNAGTNSSTGTGVGFIAQDLAQAEIMESLIQDNEGIGVYGGNKAHITLTDSVIEGNGFAGVTLTDATGMLSRNTIQDQIANYNGGGVGIFLQSRTADADLICTLDQNIIKDQPVSLYAVELAEGAAEIRLSDNYFSITGTTIYHHNLHFLNVLGEIQLDENCIDTAGGFYLFLSQSNAILNGNIFQGSYSNFMIQQQVCSSLPPPAGGYTIPLTLSQETFPAPAIHCLCNVNSLDGSECFSSPDTPYLQHAFDIVEATVIY